MKIIDLIKEYQNKNYYKVFQIWRMKNLTELQYMTFMALLVGIACGLASVVLKNTVHYT